jgi:cell wall-associated NlpC family hydrolase
VQAVAQMLRINMPRDAYQQALCGSLVMWDQRKPGNLAYFANADGKVTHVGILLDDDRIIHAYGKVRVDQLTANGIVNEQTGLLTHKLFDIRTWSKTM